MLNKGFKMANISFLIRNISLNYESKTFDLLLFLLLQGSLVQKLRLGTFLTLGPNLQSYFFQEYISLNPRGVEQNYTIYIFMKKWLKFFIETINVNFKLIIRCEN